MMNGLKLGLLLLALLVAVTISEWRELEWIVYSGLALLFVAWVWSRASLIGVGFQRTLDADRVFAGTDVREQFRLTNRSHIPKTWVAVTDRSTLPGHAFVRSTSIGRRSATCWEVSTQAHQRGRYRLGPVELQSGDPFGLFTNRSQVELSHELLVYPRLVPLPKGERFGAELSGATRVAPGRSAGSPVIRSLRQYVVGDPVNRIAWRSSARHGLLLIKELEPDPVSDEWILLDLVPQHGRERRATELAVSLGASFAIERLDAARDVGLLVNRCIPAIVDADAGDRQRLRILETLAVVEPYGDADPSSLISRFGARFSRSTNVVVVSTGSGRRHVQSLRHLLQRGVPVLAIAVGVTENADDGWTEVERLGVEVIRYSASAEPLDGIPARRHVPGTVTA
ncbi:MAG TPA: DUF58 domain-containing protein [Thermomicrobiales bacterium]|nr:DUF58 domain-containing protein [Thermomicrobiales bacterium]